ncbi:uncharacterized protein K02A2.6-like [Leguminivora glycinivorella]|uniref:uncharacterized protein K02A2.6-like n=1 Tax=Leguminivora glycinivorella TaxID=1035111 RepID=UPI00200F28D5|nr:uncharacterized protein K02A2.6-like [Leguminivora glycinivorella]
MEELKQQMEAQMALIQQLQTQLAAQTSASSASSQTISFLPGMTTPPPQPFTFKATDWENWIIRFEQYRETTRLKMLPSETQVNSLLYIMGAQANNVITSMKLSESDMKSYDIVKAKFESYYSARKTKMYSRARFNQRIQNENECIDDFITDLHNIAKKCEFGTLEEELIRDRIVAGMRDTELSKALQNLEEEPKLETVINRVRHAEIVEANRATLNPTTQTPEVNFINKRVSAKKPIKQTGTSESCRKCGRTPKHKFADCEAANSTCKGCGLKGHWLVVCKKKKEGKKEYKTVNEVTEEDFFFGSIETSEKIIDSVNSAPRAARSKPKYATIFVNSQKVKFKVDTGASETVISPELRIKLQLPQPIVIEEKLLGPCKITLPSRGVCRNIKLTWQGKSMLTDVYVLADQHTPLLGLTECDNFGIVKWHSKIEIMQISNQILPEEEFQELFTGLGVMKGQYCIKLKENAKPYAVTTPRHISIPIRPKVEKALQNLQDIGVIEPITHPTEWCAPMVPVPDKNDNTSVRVTVDYTELNKSVMREYHPLPTVEECLAQLAGSKYFSKIDAVKSYFQVELTEDSKDLTTFITPFGRYRFNRMPMGMNSSSEIFQRKMATILAGVKGCINHVDDTLIHGKTVQEHDENLKQVLKALQRGGVTLNKKKCIFRTNECTFLGYKVTNNGIQPLQDKVKAINKLPIPEDLTALRSFMGAVNQHLRFLPNIADVTKPLRDLLKKDSSREWNAEHTKAFQEIKKLLTTAPQLAHYDPNLETRVSADASQYGMGAVIEQKHGDVWKPVHFWSSAFTPTQQRYAMIEKEACATTMACERFKLYLQGLPTFTLRSDHKPLLAILGSKPIADLPTRLQRFRMRMTPFNYKIEHVPGKYMYTADMLSRAPLPTEEEDKDILERSDKLDETTFLSIHKELPFSDDRLKKIKEAQQEDEICKKLYTYIMHGWPNYKNIEEEIKPFWKHKEDLVLTNKLITCGLKIYIPTTLRETIIEKLHTGHVTAIKSQMRAKQAVWWPTWEHDITLWSNKCEFCAKMTTQRPEPLIPGDVPKYPFEIIAADLCTYKGKEYLVVRDVLSNYPEIVSLTSTTSMAIINHLKCIMARHGIPRILRSDNGPQFASKQFKQFARDWEFTHTTSSPHFPQSNGAAEIGIKIFKTIFDKNPEDPLLGLLHYRTTPNKLGVAPSQIAMSRLLNTNIPTTSSALKPKTQDIEHIREQLLKRREKAKENYDRRHRAKELPELETGKRVFLPSEQIYGTVTGKREEPRSYNILTEKGSEMRKNRKAIIELPDQTNGLKKQSSTPALTPSLPYLSSSPSQEPVICIIPEDCNQPNTTTDQTETMNHSPPTEIQRRTSSPVMRPKTPSAEISVSSPIQEPNSETVYGSPQSTPVNTPESSSYLSLTSSETSPEKEIITTRSGRHNSAKTSMEGIASGVDESTSQVVPGSSQDSQDTPIIHETEAAKKPVERQRTARIQPEVFNSDQRFSPIIGASKESIVAFSNKKSRRPKWYIPDNQLDYQDSNSPYIENVPEILPEDATPCGYGARLNS